MYSIEEIRPTHLEVHLDRLIYNLRSIRNRIGDDVKLIAVIKGDVYGMGVKGTLKTFDENGVDMYGVATVEEGIELRRVGTKKDILIVGYTPPSQYKRAIEYDITMTIFDLDEAKELEKVAREMDKTANIHIKIDTGMTRIGFEPIDESVEDIVEISKLDNVKITGTFTHFTDSEMTDKSVTKDQADLYFNFIKEMEKRGVNPGVKHISNSSATIDLEEYQLDGVRVGCALLGLYFDTVDIEKMPVKLTVQLVSTISRVRTVPKGTTVGYNRTYTVEKDNTDIATIPAGYADGYQRCLSNKGYVSVNGQKAPIRGLICMDQMMVDTTGINAKVGDRVVFYGFEEGAPDIFEIAKLAETHFIDLVSALKRRVPIIYYMNGKIVGVTDYMEETRYALEKLQ